MKSMCCTASGRPHSACPRVASCHRPWSCPSSLPSSLLWSSRGPSSSQLTAPSQSILPHKLPTSRPWMPAGTRHLRLPPSTGPASTRRSTSHRRSPPRARRRRRRGSRRRPPAPGPPRPSEASSGHPPRGPSPPARRCSTPSSRCDHVGSRRGTVGLLEDASGGSRTWEHSAWRCFDLLGRGRNLHALSASLSKALGPRLALGLLAHGAQRELREARDVRPLLRGVQREGVAAEGQQQRAELLKRKILYKIYILILYIIYYYITSLVQMHLSTSEP